LPRVKQFEDRECKICGDVFQVNIKSKRSRSKQTCSLSCSGKLGAKTSLMDTNCKACNKNIKAPKGSVLSGKGVYCSDECRKKRYTRECVYCGTKFYGTKNVEKYCSNDCFHNDRRGRLEDLTCFDCGEQFQRPHLTAVNKERVFCSQRCANRTLSRENPNRYGSRWGRIREKRVKLDNYTCQRCGLHKKEKYSLEVHHKEPYNTFDNEEEANHMDNLETLCTKCHWEHHGINK